VAALDGVCELLAEQGDPQSAQAVVLALVRDERPGWLGALPVTFFDRLCAAIYAAEFSPRVECRSDCTACGEPFDFRFELDQLLRHQDDEATALGLSPDADGYWRLDEGLAVRPPTLADLAAHPDQQELAARLVRNGDPHDERIEGALEAGAPLLTLPIATECPHCEAAQQVGFDMARHLVASIAAERAFLIRETHLVAARYGWSHESIMALPRKDRRAYAALIESERSAALARRRA
jgi:hypothetical protein